MSVRDCKPIRALKREPRGASHYDTLPRFSALPHRLGPASAPAGLARRLKAHSIVRRAWVEHLAIGALASIAVLTFTSLAFEHWRRIPGGWSPRVAAHTVDHETPVEIGSLADHAPAVASAAEVIVTRGERLGLEVAESTHRWQLRPWMALTFGVDVLPLGFVSAMMVIVPRGDRPDPWGLISAMLAVSAAVIVLFSYEELIAAFRRRDPRRIKRLSARSEHAP
jgi:hypothetical protein